MISKTRPTHFTSAIEVAGCLMEYEGKILLLLRNQDRPQGNTWSRPGGKIEANETPAEGLAREIFEETGLTIAQEEYNYVDTYYVEYPNLKFVYHVFRLLLPERPEITLQKTEHVDFRWVTPQEALALALIPDEDFCLKDFYGI